MRNLAIIPARSGSKGLKDKNIKLLNGKPLMAYTIDAANESNCFDEIMVSTDSESYAAIARQYGAEVPFLRDPKSSTDMASSWDVVLEVLSNYKLMGRQFDTICLLQPTSPMRKATDILKAYTLLETALDVNAISSVCEVDHSPLWCMTLDNTKSLNVFRKKSINLPRQKMPTYYRLNGAIYIRRIKYHGNITLEDDNEIAYVMDRASSIDIDTAQDFDLAEYLITKLNQ